MEICKPKPHSTHYQGHDKNKQKRRTSTIHSQLEEQPSLRNSKNPCQKTAYIHPSAIYFQCKKFHPTHQRTSRNSIRPEPEIILTRHLRLASLDITNMYTNIPTHELLSIIEEICHNSYIEKDINTDIVRLSKTIINQNYFQFLGKTFIQTEGLAMGAPTSCIFSEKYIITREQRNLPSSVKNTLQDISHT